VGGKIESNNELVSLVGIQVGRRATGGLQPQPCSTRRVESMLAGWLRQPRCIEEIYRAPPGSPTLTDPIPILLSRAHRLIWLAWREASALSNLNFGSVGFLKVKCCCARVAPPHHRRERCSTLSCVCHYREKDKGQERKREKSNPITPSCRLQHHPARVC
jgi:hypothetical protein